MVDSCITSHYEFLGTYIWKTGYGLLHIEIISETINQKMLGKASKKYETVNWIFEYENNNFPQISYEIFWKAVESNPGRKIQKHPFI